MAQYDPTQRRETWLLQEIGMQPRGKKVYRALSYVLVSYDNDPVQYIEPSPVDETQNVTANDQTLNGNYGRQINPATDGLGRVSDFLFVTRRPFEVFAYNDVDAANNLGQLPDVIPGRAPSYGG